MRKNYFLVGMFAMAALTFAACSNEDLSVTEATGDNETTEVIEGMPTYARLSFRLGGTRTRATVAGSTEEQAVKNIHVYVFSNGVFEASTTPVGEVLPNSTGVLHSEVMKLTSGLKNILVVANVASNDWFPAPKAGTSLTVFQNQLLELYTTPGRLAHEGTVAVPRAGEGYKNLQGGDKSADNGYLMANSIAESSFTLKPGVSQADAERDSYVGEDPADYNHFNITLQRVTAKIEVTYNGADALVYKAPQGDLGTEVEVGKLTLPHFTVRNLPQQVYLFKHSTVDNPLSTPLYNLTNTTSSWADFSVFDEQNVPDIAITDKTKGTAPGHLYIPENANAIPVIGNTSYVLVKGTFEPNKALVITDIDASGKPVYGYSGTTDPITAYTYAPAWGSEIYAVPASVTGEADRVKHGLQTTLKAYLVKVGLKDYIGKDETNPYYDGVLGKNVYYSIKIGIKDGIYNTVIISKNVQKDDKTYESTPVETVKFLQYENGICYYRINIQDKTYPENNNLYYSVTRNNFYNVSVTSISGIGYPSEGDITVEPETPISQKTYMQAHITVEEWRIIDQDADLN